MLRSITSTGSTQLNTPINNKLSQNGGSSAKGARITCSAVAYSARRDRTRAQAAPRVRCRWRWPSAASRTPTPSPRPPSRSPRRPTRSRTPTPRLSRCMCGAGAAGRAVADVVGYSGEAARSQRRVGERGSCSGTARRRRRRRSIDWDEAGRRWLEETG